MRKWKIISSHGLLWCELNNICFKCTLMLPGTGVLYVSFMNDLFSPVLIRELNGEKVMTRACEKRFNTWAE